MILAPTDAALGQAVVTLKRLPSRVRQGLNVESGLNDGICVPLFWIVLAIAQAESGDIGDGAAVRLVLEQIGYGILAGVLAGIAAACVVIVARGHGRVEGSWLQVVPLAGAGLAFGLADPIGGSGFIAAFVGGFVFGAIRRRTSEDVGYLIEEVGEVFNAVTFIVFGAVLLGPVLGDVTWQVVLYAVLSLTVVRLIPVAISMIGTGLRRPTLAFLGWFGPRGLASIVFAVLVLEEGGLPHDDLILENDLPDDRTLGSRSRAHRRAPGQSLRRLARVASPGCAPGSRELGSGGRSLAPRRRPPPVAVYEMPVGAGGGSVLRPTRRQMSRHTAPNPTGGRKVSTR